VQKLTDAAPAGVLLGRTSERLRPHAADSRPTGPLTQQKARSRAVAPWHDRDVSTRSDTTPDLDDLRRLRSVRDRIDREYAEPLDVEVLARGVHMSAGHLSREFRRAYGEPPYSYLMTRRIERAMALLRRGDRSVTEVCFEVGCSSLGTFSTRFTELVGVPPSVYRRDHARATAGMPACVATQVTRPVRNREATPAKPRLD
jgi:AraC-like DNA-binding protein